MTKDDYESRVKLRSQDQYRFAWSLNYAPLVTVGSTISITTNNPCRRSSVVRQELAFGIPIYGADFWKEYPIPAFSDTVDRRRVYQRGICGEKVVVIDELSAPFLSVLPNIDDPINGSSTLVFDGTNLK